MPLDTHQVNALIEENVALVGYIVRSFKAGLPAHVLADDLTSAGMLGLVLAAQSYDESHGVPFKKWADFKIRGALVDELRSMDWASRSVRTNARRVTAARNHLAVAFRRAPTTSEVAQETGMSIEEVRQLDTDVHTAALLSLEGFSPEVAATLTPDREYGPEQLLLDREQRMDLHHAITGLPERLRRIVQVSYYEEQTMAGLAVEFGVTESRISQLRREALKKLRIALAEPEAA